MFINTTDKKLYILCEKILDSKQLEKGLHDELSTTLNSSNLKELFYFDEYLIKALNDIEVTTNKLKYFAQMNLPS